MNLPQLFINALAAEIKAALPDHTVEAREPAETELAANKDVRQVFLTTEGLELPEGQQIASQGESSVVLLPVLASLVMPRPGSADLALRTLRRRIVFMQAVQRAVRAFAAAHTGIELNILQEQPTLIEGYYVSIIGVELVFDLSLEDIP